MYGRNLFTTKSELFKADGFLEELKRSIDLYGNNPFFFWDIVRLAIKALELLISKVLLAVAKVQEECVKAEISIVREVFCNVKTARRSEKSHR